MCSYVAKKNNAAVVRYTNHYTAEVEGPKEKPVLILDFNKNKDGVIMDKCLTEYSTNRRPNRWYLAFFNHILDVAAFAASFTWRAINT